MPADAGVIRIDEQTGLGVALATDGNGRYGKLDPYAGAQLALAEAYRNVAATGARPVAVTDCLNFGSPEDPAVMWQFAEAVRGLADGCQFLGIPVTGGNVSFYNQTGDVAIHPTPVVGVLGVLDDVRRRLPMGFTGPGAQVVLLGASSAVRRGRRWRTVISAAARRQSFWLQNGLPRRCSPPRRGPGCWPRPMTCPTAASRSRWPSAAWPGGTAAG
jgi:phosphoribosylformylglycinamidine synthase